VSLPTLDEFLTWKHPTNSYVDYPGFCDLYVRSNKVYVRFDGGGWFCEPVLQIANVTATEPGNGAFTRLVDHIIGLGRAIYVENVHNPRFRRKLTEMGFMVVNDVHVSEMIIDSFGTDDISGRNYLFNFEDRLHTV
jgi:hypothetical protein